MVLHYGMWVILVLSLCLVHEETVYVVYLVHLIPFIVLLCHLLSCTLPLGLIDDLFQCFILF